MLSPGALSFVLSPFLSSARWEFGKKESLLMDVEAAVFVSASSTHALL